MFVRLPLSTIALAAAVAGCNGSSGGPAEGTADAQCAGVIEEAECQALAGCEFWGGYEHLFDTNGECSTEDNVEAVGFCIEGAFGGAGVVSSWYHVETERVVTFGFDPPSSATPVGWNECMCDGTSPPACLCTQECSMETPASSGGSGGSGT